MSEDQSDVPADEAIPDDSVSVAPFIDDDDEPEVEADVEESGAAEPPDAKAKADAVVAERKVERRTVTSRRVTPKAGAKVEATSGSKARDAKKTESVAARPAPVPQTGSYARGPSPWWVPAIMFGLLILGALVIMTNYMGVFGDASNTRLVIGLVFILGGIVTATQYR